MADITGYDRGEIVPASGAAIPKKYHDNGDNTYSEQMYVGGGAATNAGAASINAGQATAGAASAELVAARATRRGVTVRNTDASASCYVGEGTVTAANGFLLKAGESIALYTVAAVNGIRATTDVVVCFIEEYD